MALTWVRPLSVPMKAGEQRGLASIAQRGYISNLSSPTEVQYAALCRVYGMPAARTAHECYVLVSSGADGCVRAWDGTSGAQMYEATCSGEGGVRSRGCSWVMNVDAHRETRSGAASICYVASVGRQVVWRSMPLQSRDGICAMDTQSETAHVVDPGPQLAPLAKTVDCACFCSDGSIAACCYGGVSVWKSPVGVVVETEPLHPRHYSYKG